MTPGQCLCGANRFRLEGELSFMHHCHCGFCRKIHGTPYATLIAVAPENLHWGSVGTQIRYSATPAFTRISCGICGSPLPSEGEGLPPFVPNGLLEEDGGQRPEFHMFVASKAPWFEFEDEAPSFDAFPPGIDAPSHPTRLSSDPPGPGARGSCLCGDVQFIARAPAIAARYCHCRRCQRARGAARAANLILGAGNVRFSKGEDAVRDYKLPEARFFAQSFCVRCGSKVPRIDPTRDIAIVPLGSLDDPPPMLPQEHIFVASRAAWDVLEDDLPCHQEGPTS